MHRRSPSPSRLVAAVVFISLLVAALPLAGAHARLPHVFAQSGDVPTAPSLIRPDAGAISSDRTPTFSWTSVSGAKSYRFELALDSEFTAMVDAHDTIGRSRTAPTQLDPGTQFF